MFMLSNCTPAKTLEINHEVEVTRQVEVTRLVEVTREILVTPTFLLPTKAPTASPLQPADARASKYIGGNASPNFSAGEPGKLSIVATGKFSGCCISLVVRNNTPSSVINISVSAVAYSADGKMLASGGSQGFTPNFVRSGEISLGYVYFEDVKLPENARFEYEVTGVPSDKPGTGRDLEVEELNKVDNRLVGKLLNTHDVTISGPIDVYVYCFDQAGNILDDHQNFTDKDKAVPNDTIPFQVEITNWDQCPVYLVVGSGYAF